MHPERSDPDGRHVGGVGVVVLTFESDPVLLRRCLQSVVTEWEASQHSSEAILDVLVADNASVTLDRSTEALVKAMASGTDAPLRFVQLGANFGFAGGINRAVRALDPDADLVFLLNPDAEIEPGAVLTAAAALRGEPTTTVSAAPKMLLSRPGDDGPVIDAVANAVNARGEAFNIGLGQPDLGQYDTPQHCFGPCFGAALLRRSALSPDAVGGLDESLFLYYEDVEWNWRAQILGFDSVTVPAARVRHVMSASTRDRPYDFKFRLTERNLLLVALACIPGRDAYLVAGRRMAGLLRGSVRGHYPLAGLRAVGGVLVRLPRTVTRRGDLQSRRRRSHEQILAYGRGEKTFFDAVRYEPIDPTGARAFAVERREMNRNEAE
jgi:N-acetylglucosaminyl-diphospho-decaprenol L-rhamnosyltransferase